jgi:hypothetical protein
LSKYKARAVRLGLLKAADRVVAQANMLRLLLEPQAAALTGQLADARPLLDRVQHITEDGAARLGRGGLGGFNRGRGRATLNEAFLGEAGRLEASATNTLELVVVALGAESDALLIRMVGHIDMTVLH